MCRQTAKSLPTFAYIFPYYTAIGNYTAYIFDFAIH